MAHTEAFRQKRKPRFAGHQLSTLHLYEEVTRCTGPSLLGKHDDSLQVFVLWISSLVEVKSLLLWRERQEAVDDEAEAVGDEAEARDNPASERPHVGTWVGVTRKLRKFESQGPDPNFKTKPQKWALLQKHLLPPQYTIVSSNSQKGTMLWRAEWRKVILDKFLNNYGL